MKRTCWLLENAVTCSNHQGCEKCQVADEIEFLQKFRVGCESAINTKPEQCWIVAVKCIKARSCVSCLVQIAVDNAIEKPYSTGITI